MIYQIRQIILSRRLEDTYDFIDAPVLTATPSLKGMESEA